MRFRCRPSVFALAATTVAIACSTFASEPLLASYSLQLHDDSAGVYGIGQCRGVPFYCSEWRPSTRIREVSVLGWLRTRTIVQEGDTLYLDTPLHLDSLPVNASNLPRGNCIMLTMRIVSSGRKIRGTWEEQLDCHGLRAAGTVTGTRN